MASIKSRISTSFCINLFFAFTVIIFGPYEIFIANSSDFVFTFRDIWWMLILVGICYLVVSILLLTLLPFLLSKFIQQLIFAFTLCCYAQAMFMNGKMEVLIGQRIAWDRATIIVNLLLWIGIFLVVFGAGFCFRNHWNQLLCGLSLALVAVQTTALVSLLLTTEVLTEEKNGYLSQDGMLELSKESNVIVFLLDFFDGRTMDSILAENPNFLEPLEGFTYFPNAISIHSRTYPSITYLLTGNICHFDQRPMSYVNNAFSNSNFIPELCRNNVDTGLYTFDYYIGARANGLIRNYVEEKQPLKFRETVDFLIDMVLYRDMPYFLKERFSYEAPYINSNVVDEEALKALGDSEGAAPFRNFDDEWFYSTFEEEGISANIENPVFRFYHLGSCHLDLSNQEALGMRSLEIVYAFLNQMRELGIYERSTVIILSDHGYSGGGGLDMPHKTAVPLMIAKPEGISNGMIQTSDAPVSHVDFIPTVLDGFSLDYESYGKTLFKIEEGEERERYYYYSALNTDEEGEIELREYLLDGDARDENSYHFTGNSWDILYSYNKVAGE